MHRALDYTATWNDAAALFKAHREMALAIAGVFILLPLILFGYLAPQAEVVPGQTGNAALQQALMLLKDMLPWLIGLSLVSIVGELAILFNVMDDSKPTVGESLSLALRAFIPVFLARLISGLAILLGVILLIVPGIYLSIKFSQISQAIVAEKITNPMDALSRSWALTKGNSIQIFGFVLVVGIVALLGMFVVNLIISLILTLLFPVTIAQFAIMVISSVLQTLISVLMLFVSAAIYRQLSVS
jgi:hypothetical protein